MMPMCDWSEHTSPDGKKYFYNAKTQESVWEKPKELEEKGHRVLIMAYKKFSVANLTDIKL